MTKRDAATGSKSANDLDPTQLTASDAIPKTMRKARPPSHLTDLAAAQRRDWLVELGYPAMRASQLAHHYFTNLTNQPNAMTDLPAASRDELVKATLPELLTKITAQVGDHGDTIKTLFQLTGGARLETVLMRYPERVTVCISTQAGCGIGCPFCATGKLGLIRNLSAAEITEQVRLAAQAAQTGQLNADPARLSNIVFMGMGEPLANYAPTLQAVRNITAPPPAGFGISARNLTISTCGIVPGIKKLIAENLPLRLAVSLHAADDATRDLLVPLNRRYPVAAVLDAAHAYYRASRRRVSIEYALIRGINDKPSQAAALARELGKRGSNWAHVNPIALNDVPESPWTASREHVTAGFVELLRAAGIVTTIRDTRGAEIDGACGQLAAKEYTDDA